MHTSGRRPASAATIKPRLRLDVQHAVTTDGLPVRATLRRWLLLALDRDAMITLRFVGAGEGRRLNNQFRGRDHATNVLTFVYDSVSGAIDKHAPTRGAPAVPLSGDIVLCVPVLKREAKAAGKSLRAHCAHLVVHGALHMQGYDHQSGKDARVMESLETRLLASLGYGDPYAT